MPTSGLPDKRRLLIFALGLPAAVVAVDQLTWASPTLIPDYDVRRTIFLWSLVTKCALLAWTAGKVFGATPWGWGIFIWSMLLIDLQTFSQAMIHAGHDSGPTHIDIGACKYPLVSAQFGLLIVWCLLGTQAFGWRMAILLFGSAITILLCRALYNDYRWPLWPREEPLIAVQSIAISFLAAIVFSMRLAKFRLMSTSHRDGLSASNEALQFGVKHMIIWTTAVVPLLLITKGIDMAVLSHFTSLELYPAATIGVGAILVALTAIWLTLGDGFVVARWVAFMGAALGIGAYVQLQAEGWQSYYGRYTNSELLRLVFEMGETRQWPTWYALTGGLLAAMLLFLRACGYRLAKVRSVAK